MNGETRALGDWRRADPTLSALDQKWGVVSIEDGAVDGPATAHEMDPGPDCDPADAFRRAWARYARWFAVPCRECFPDAPEPGYLPCDCGRPDHRWWAPDGLAWQTDTEEQP